MDIEKNGCRYVSINRINKIIHKKNEVLKQNRELQKQINELRRMKVSPGAKKLHELKKQVSIVKRANIRIEDAVESDIKRFIGNLSRFLYRQDEIEMKEFVLLHFGFYRKWVTPGTVKFLGLSVRYFNTLERSGYFKKTDHKSATYFITEIGRDRYNKIINLMYDKAMIDLPPVYAINEK